MKQQSLQSFYNVKQLNNKEDADFDSDTFTNPFAPLETSSTKSSSRIVDTSNMHTFQQPLINTKRWTKDHPLVTIIGDPSKHVSTRQKLATDAMLCYFHAFLTKVKPKNYKETTKESSWIEAMQEEIHGFERLEVFELVPRASHTMIIALKKRGLILRNHLDQSLALKPSEYLSICYIPEHGSLSDGREDRISEWDTKRR
nr:hypothetical protein [Tanacetum cinerariifolium]